MANFKYYAGIDPGKSGAIAIISEQSFVDYIGFSETERDVSDFMDKYKGKITFCYLEKVSAMPGQGVKSMFTFGTWYGFARGLLISHKTPFDLVSPQKWQKFMKCLCSGNKNITKGKAQEIFPQTKITHKIADALLIAKYCERVTNGSY